MDPNDQCPGCSDTGARCRYLAGHPGRHSWQDKICAAVTTITGQEVTAELVCNLAEGHNGLHYDATDRVIWDGVPVLAGDRKVTRQTVG